MSNPVEGPLAGVKVVDLSHVIAGPMASFYLAQMGAEVIKIEPPQGGDIYRGQLYESQNADMPSNFVSLNAGKRSLAIDIRTPDGQEVVRQLARDADVVIQNFRPTVMPKYGLDYDSLSAINPRLIYCSITAYGHDGEYAGYGAYDHVIQAITGMMMLSGDATAATPSKVGFPVIDVATGLTAALAISGALVRQRATGQGEFIDASMVQASLGLMQPLVTGYLSDAKRPHRVGNRGHSGSPAADVFACADGWIALAANTPRQFMRLVRYLEIESLCHDDRAFDANVFADERSRFLRARDNDYVRSVLTEAIGRQSAATMERQLNQLDIPAAKVRSVDQFLDDFGHSGSMTLPIQELRGAANGRAVTSGLGFASPRNEASWRSPHPAPALGEHSADILLALGYSADAIDDMRQRQVLAMASNGNDRRTR
ncbi:MAG: CoA transferase [Candidimonas sp.]